MFALGRNVLVAVAGLSILQLVQFAKSQSERKGPLGAILRLIAKVPAAAAPILGAALVLATEQRKAPPQDEAHELSRLSRRLQVLSAINPTEAANVMERTKLDVRLKSLGFGELPSSELDIVYEAVQQLSNVEEDADYRDLQAIKEQLDEAEVSEAQLERLAVRRYEVEEAQELYRLLKALNTLAADMEGGPGGELGVEAGAGGGAQGSGREGLEEQPQA